MEPKQYYIGIDVGGTSVKEGLFDEDGNLLAKASVPTPPIVDAAGFAAVTEAIDRVIAKAQIPRAFVAGIGLAVPCPIPASGDAKVKANIAINLPELRIAIQEHCPDAVVKYENDANAAAMGEAWLGSAKGVQNVVMVTIGTGVGAGVLSGGKLVHGMMHPEAGHILVTRDPRDTIGEHSACPFHDNCLEGLIAGPGVKRRWDGKSAGDMADDPEAMDLLAGYLAQALMTFILCYAPQKIVIGGGVADHTPIVPLARKKCAEMLNGYIVTPEVNDIDTYIVNNSLEGKQGIMGCLALGAQALQ